MQAKRRDGQQKQPEIVRVVATNDIETVKKNIFDEYGFMVTDAYAANLIKFVEILYLEK